MKFHYVALDRSAQKVSGVIDAENDKSAIFQLEKQNLTPLKIQARHRPISTKALGRKPTAKDKLLFIDQLVTMLSSGVSLPIGLTALSKTASSPYLAHEVSQMLQRLDQGESFSNTLQSSKLELPNFAIQLVRSGEFTGQLKEALQGVSEQMRYDLTVKKEFSQALTYPIILIVAGILAIGIIFIMVVPKFANLLDKVQDLPLLAFIVLNTGVFFNEWKQVIIIGAGTLVGLIIPLSRLASFRKMVSGLLLHTPGIGHLLRMNQVTRWSGMLGILLANRIPILEALNLANQAVDVPELKARLDLVAAKVREGSRLTDAVQEADVVSAVAIDLINVGEKTGKLADMLSSISRIYAEELRETVKKLLSLIEPLSILMIGSMVGLIMTGVILAITSMNQAVT
jgi:general secretion pathway protein F